MSKPGDTTAPVPVEGAGANAEPVKVTETMPMPMRDRFSQRYVVITTGIVFMLISLTAAINWLNGKPVSEAQDRWWMLIVGVFVGTLTSTSAHVPIKKE